MVTIGLNLLVAGVVGKNVRIARLYSCVTKFFVADDAGGLEEALCAC